MDQVRHQNAAFNGDRPIQELKEDRLGFDVLAKRLAEAIHGFSPREGFVIGIEGDWGSGKSSLLNLIVAALRQKVSAPEIVRFSPWLISNRSALMNELFAEVAKASERIDADSLAEAKIAPLKWYRWPKRNVAARQRTSKAVSKYVAKLSVAANAAPAFEGFIPYGAVVVKGVTATAKVIEKAFSGPSIEAEKEGLRRELHGLKRKIVVLIDDLDRLEPLEALEVMRLVRAVADLPNIIYVLCYSRKILVHSLATALDIDDGGDYLEKILQTSFTVPAPEDFTLRKLLLRDIEEAFASTGPSEETAESHNRSKRLRIAVDIEGGRSLRTPRHVARVVNAVRLYAGSVIDHIDLADMVWLQLIRLRNATLYSWIEKYLNGYAAFSSGALITEAEKSSDIAQLFKALEEDEGTTPEVRLSQVRHLATVLPGISEAKTQTPSPVGDWNLYGREDDSTLSEYALQRRIGSLHHFRFYFALSKPGGAVDDSAVATFIEACKAGEAEAKNAFKVLCIRDNDGAAIPAEGVLGRLKGGVLDKFNSYASRSLISALADGMDDLALLIGKGEWDKYWCWMEAQSIFERSLTKLNNEDRGAALKSMFSSSKARGWVANVFRDQVFAFRNINKEYEKFLTAEEFEECGEMLISQFKTLPNEALLKIPQLISAFYGWYQFRPEELPIIRKRIEELAQEDANFLSLLECFRSWRATNDIVSYPIPEETVETFMSPSAVTYRLQKLAVGANKALQAQAKALLAAMDEGKRK